METNIFLKAHDKADFVTPDFLIFRCLESEYQDVHASDVLLAGEVLSPSNPKTDIEAKKIRYAGSGNPLVLGSASGPQPPPYRHRPRLRAGNRAGQIHEGVRPLHQTNYLLADEWTPANTTAIEIERPFPISIPWAELEF